MDDRPLHVLVLSGGPDREREVSLKSGMAVARALLKAGHRVTVEDLQPGLTEGFDRFVEEGGDVVFPVLHGRWGEGGGAQRFLDNAGLPYVGCRPDPAALCMNKTETKKHLQKHDVPTPAFELIDVCLGNRPTLNPPAVIKPNDDGSSIDLAICPDADTLERRWDELAARNPLLLVEQFIDGKELTVGWVDGRVLPPIWIKPATAFYDYDAKYERDDTGYEFDLGEPADVVQRVNEIATRCADVLGVRHLCRVDLMLDAAGTPWVIEVNTMPGFTDHSLLPMAARHAGIDMPALCNRLVRMAVADAVSG